jgi:membrane protein involved in colicin uptake
MAKKKNRPVGPKTEASDKPSTLKDLLSADTVAKLKAQADQLKADEAARKEELRRQAEEARKAEQKRLDNDFKHLLENSSLDWRKYKS